MSVVLLNICRLCGELTENLIELCKEKDFIQKIENYLNIEISATIFPPRICHPCKGKLAKWDKYAHHVLSVHEFLESLSCTSGDLLEFMVGYTLMHKDTHKNPHEKVLKRTRNAKRREKLEDSIPGLADESGDSNPGKCQRKIRLKITKIKDNESQVEYLQDEDQASSDKENEDDKTSMVGDDLSCPEKTEVPNLLPAGTTGPETKSNSETNYETGDNDFTDSGSLSWECTECTSKEASWSALARHCREAHAVSPRFNCSCGKTLHSRTSVIKHHLKHTVGLQYKCDMCSKSYHRKRLLEIHALSHLPKEEQPWLCCKCCRRFHSEALLKQHERMHLPPENRSFFPCEICKKNKSAVAAHVRSVHLRERPFVCDQCGLSFTSKGILDEHLNVHSDICNFHCKDCCKSFKTKYRLRMHMDTHLGTHYECPVCALSLNTRRTLRMHLLVHEDHKGFRCTTCGKAFKRSKDLKNHENLHTGRKPYSCLFCARTFANGSNCRSHKRRMHPVELRLYEEALITSSSSQPKVQTEPLQGTMAGMMSQQEDLLAPLNLKNQVGGVKDEDDLDELTASLNLQYPLHTPFSPTRMPATHVFAGASFFARQ